MKRYLGRNKSAVLWQEWLGLTSAFVWFFCSMVSYYDPLFSDVWTEPLFMLLLCAGLTGTALLWEKYPEWLERALPYTTLAGAICTALIPFLPVFAAKAVFWLSALLMTPLLCRRLYGVLSAAREDARIRTYISAVSVTIVVQMIWSLLPLPFTIKFPVILAVALLGLWGAGRRLPEHKTKAQPSFSALKTPIQLARIMTVFVLLVVLNIFNTIIHTHVVDGSLNDNDLFSLVTWATMPLSFMFFAYLSDFKRERLGFSLGMAMLLIGCFVALMPGGSVLAAPVLLLGEFGGTITEFCFLTMPLLFFPFSKRPFLVASSGLIAHTLFATLVPWTQDLWLPQALLGDQIDRPLIIFGAVCAAALVPLAFSVWRRQEDATLMAALLGLKKQTEIVTVLPEKHVEPTASVESPVERQSWTHDLDLIESEHRIATLLCDGLTRAEIAERTEMTVSQVSEHLRNIREKLDAKPPVGHDAYVRESARRYGLTPRETEVFGEILLGRSNTEISANLYIESTTVKTHVNKIMKKTSMSSRAEIIAKVSAGGEVLLPAE